MSNPIKGKKTQEFNQLVVYNNHMICFIRSRFEKGPSEYTKNERVIIFLSLSLRDFIRSFTCLIK